ncbi:MAG: DUF1835 domain-containing protein, partial [Sphingobacteriaceae bacterium]|nr:DUF1835 domain-containing protein [Cytophagaceae bacterium]
MKTLHVLNGDSTAYSFRQTALPGEVLVWREMLSEGQVPVTDDFAKFWQERGDFLAEHYDFDRDEYERMVVNEAQRLLDCRTYDEVTLWFEFDLFCQINLLYLLNFFANHDLGQTHLTLVSPGSHPEHPNFKGMGELNPAQLAALWPERITLTAEDLNIGQQAWQAYRADATEALRTLVEKASFGQLSHLKTALLAHLSRFPAKPSGLGFIEKFWLNYLETEHSEKIPLLTRFWDENPQFGFGDLQLLRTLDDLKAAGLVHENGQL